MPKRAKFAAVCSDNMQRQQLEPWGWLLVPVAGIPAGNARRMLRGFDL